MKKFVLPVIFGGLLFSSCKKSSSTDCEETVAGIAGSYKLTKVTVAGLDLTSTIVIDCVATGVLKLNADKTASYVESGAGCDTVEDTGTWDITGTSITTSVTGTGSYLAGGTVVNNCSSFTVTQSTGGSTIVATFTKQ